MITVKFEVKLQYHPSYLHRFPCSSAPSYSISFKFKPKTHGARRVLRVRVPLEYSSDAGAWRDVEKGSSARGHTSVPVTCTQPLHPARSSTRVGFSPTFEPRPLTSPWSSPTPSPRISDQWTGNGQTSSTPMLSHGSDKLRTSFTRSATSLRRSVC